MQLLALKLRKIHLYSMKIIAMALCILILSSCQDKGGGVVSNTNETAPTSPNNPNTPTTPEFYGPFGGPINNDSVVPAPSVYQPAYTTYDLEQMIYLANEGDTIYLDKDINITYSLFLEKSVKFESTSGKRIKLIGKNLITMIQTNVNTLSFKNIDFYLSNVQGFLTSPVNSIGDPTLSNLILDSNSFYLSGKSSLKILMNVVTMKNNSVFGLSSVSRDIPIVSIQGNALNLIANNVFDNSLNYKTAVLIRRSNVGVIADNRFVSYSKGLYGTLSLSEVNNYQVVRNYLYDKNTNRVKNDGFTIDPAVDGSAALAIELSHNVSDFGNTNYTFATHNVLTDIGNNLPEESSNLSISHFQVLNDVVPSQLFNNPQSLDFTPVCNLGSNPTISLNAISNAKSYIMDNNLPLYYTGSIKPGCL